MPNKAVNLAPYSQQEAELARRRQMAQILQQQGMQPMPMPEMPGVKASPVQGLAQLLQAFMGGFQGGRLDKKERALQTEKQAALQSEMAKLLASQGGTQQMPPGPWAGGYSTEANPMQQTMPPDPAANAAGMASQFPQVQQMAQALMGQRQKQADVTQQQQFVGGQNQMNRQNAMDIANIREAPPPPPQPQAGMGPQGTYFQTGPQAGQIIAPAPPPVAPQRNIDPNSPEGIAARLEFERKKPAPLATPRVPSFEEQTYSDYLKMPDAEKYGKSRTGYMRWKAESLPTADMKNKERAADMVGRSVDAVQNLSTKVITLKNSAQQRAKAMKMSVEAVLTDNPEYKTYQASRMALAGNLAVAQQGSRPSDADVKSIWLPLVPDVFSDTPASSDMKWKMIRTQGNIGATGASGLPAVGGTFNGAKVLKVTPVK